MFDLNKIDFIKTDEQHGRKAYSFVGLKRRENSEKLEFWLPLGFDDFDTSITYNAYGKKEKSSFESVKKFFFKMYRTFQVYRDRKLNQLTEEERTIDRDGVFEFKNGFSFTKENNEQVIFYGKLNALDKILDGYDELRISSLEKKQVRSKEIDYSKIHRYMHQAIYLEDVIYLDEMTIAKTTLQQESPPIIQLFCFIYTEIKRELEETDSISDKAFELAEKFKDSYLQSDSGLFTEDTFSDTINVLKNLFDEIDTKTTYKDEDFWHFYEAIEAFLMGERQEDNQGIYFGISNFYDVWEDLCQSYILSRPEYLSRALFADVKGKLLTRRELNLKPELNKNPFRMKLNNYPRIRYLKPDLVYLQMIDFGGDKIFERIYEDQPDTFTISIPNGKQISITNHKLTFNEKTLKSFPEIFNIYKRFLNKNPKYIENPINEFIMGKHYTDFQKSLSEYIYSINYFDLIKYGLVDSEVRIIDYKYMRQSDYENYNPNTIDAKGENKIKDDIHKQLIYEWAVQQNFENSETQSEFWIPYYSNELDFEVSKQEISTNYFFEPSQIKVIKVNFKVLQQHYVKLYNSI